MEAWVDGDRLVTAGEGLFVPPELGQGLAVVAPRVAVAGFPSERLVKGAQGLQRLGQPQLRRAQVDERRDAARQQFERGFEGAFGLLEASGFEVPHALQEKMLSLFEWLGHGAALLRSALIIRS